MAELPDAPATSRNREPILEVLEAELADRRRLLEIGSGTGQHAVYFGKRLPQLQWQTSDVRANHADIRAWLDAAGSANVLAPLALDVLSDPDPSGDFDAVFSANTAHIMSREAVVAMFALVGRLLPRQAPFCLYGPFRVDGHFTSDSNADFDASLKQRDPAMGIRDLEWLDELAQAAGLERSALYALPANNLLAVWRKSATAAGRGSWSKLGSRLENRVIPCQTERYADGDRPPGRSLPHSDCAPPASPRPNRPGSATSSRSCCGPGRAPATRSS